MAFNVKMPLPRQRISLRNSGAQSARLGWLREPPFTGGFFGQSRLSRLVFGLAGLLLCLFMFAPPCRALTAAPRTFTDLVQRAEQIVRVEVTAVNSRWDATPDGGPVIHTYVTCTVLSALKGAPPPVLTLRFLGGQVGDVSLKADGVPTFVAGRDYILFVTGNNTVFCPLVGIGQGSYPVAADAQGVERMERSDGAPLASVDAIGAAAAAPAETQARALSAPSGAPVALTRAAFEAAIVNKLGELGHAAQP